MDALPEDLLLVIFSWLPLPSIGRFSQTSQLQSRVGTRDELWSLLLARYFPDIDPVGSSALACFLSLAYAPSAPNPHVRTRRGGSLINQAHAALRWLNLARTHRPPYCPCLPCCNGSLLASTASLGVIRCPCVVTRCQRLPLALGQLGQARAGSSSLRSGGFSELHTTLGEHFRMRHEDLAILTPQTLEGIDALILCTTEGPALAAEEVAALKDWVQAGGALIVSAFSNWSRHGHYAAATVGWLGIRTIPHTDFLPRITHTFQPESISGCELTAQLCGQASPFAMSARDQFVNTGESVFLLTPEATELGAVKLCGHDLLAEPISSSAQATLAWFPPGKPATRKGRVLVCSNYHFLADSNYWNGGTLRRGDNARLLLNFLAGAVSSRAPDVRACA